MSYLTIASDTRRRRLDLRRWRGYGFLIPRGLLVPELARPPRPRRPPVDVGAGAIRDDPRRPFRVYDDLAALVLRWERCTLPRRDWNHRAHLAVAIWHLDQLDEGEATARVIAGIRRYNHAQGIPTTTTGGYHETLTLFWLHTARRYLDTVDPRLPLLEKVNRFVGLFGAEKGLHLHYYSEPRIRSRHARRQWVEPDLRPLDGGAPALCAGAECPA